MNIQSIDRSAHWMRWVVPITFSKLCESKKLMVSTHSIVWRVHHCWLYLWFYTKRPHWSACLWLDFRLNDPWLYWKLRHFLAEPSCRFSSLRWLFIFEIVQTEIGWENNNNKTQWMNELSIDFYSFLIATTGPSNKQKQKNNRSQLRWKSNSPQQNNEKKTQLNE